MSSTYWYSLQIRKYYRCNYDNACIIKKPYVILVYNEQRNKTNKRKKPILNEFAKSLAILDKIKRESSKGK